MTKTNNQQITVTKNRDVVFNKVRLLDPHRKELGIFTSKDAMFKAREYGLDLVLIAEQANPPVCQVTSADKYLYNLQKKAKDAKKNSKQTVIKEVKIKPNIGDNDFDRRVNDISKFISKGYKVHFIIEFRGRVITRIRENSKSLYDRLITSLNELEVNYKLDNRFGINENKASVVIAPN
jgi:translation initiation factor IF-3